MKKHKITFFVFILLSAMNVWAQRAQDIVVDTFEEVAGRGLEIRTNPARVRVFINGAERGVTPISFNSLPPGEYIVKLVREDYIDKEFSVTLFPASKLLALIKMEKPQGKIDITIIKAEDSSEDLPFNPIVTVNSRFLSSALELTNNTASVILPSGRHTIRAWAKGYEDVTMTITLETDETIPINIIMKPIQKKKEK